jgi:FAD/FMN-containing dehydrogenase
MTTRELTEIINAQNIQDGESVLEEYAHDGSFAAKMRPRAMVKVNSTAEVQTLIKWANETSTTLIPMSSGAPHFKGDTVPGTGGAIIVDLSGMKKIIRLDAHNRVTMIEPGVTFKELIPALEKENLRLNLPLLPKAAKSVIGSMLDRDPVIMPLYQWDAVDPLSCIEVIFGTGELFRTGSSAGPGTLEEQWKAKQAQVNPMGPGQTDFARVVQGSQGTMGIVTWATVRCETAPSLQQSFLVGDTTPAKLIDFAYQMLWLKYVDKMVLLNNVNLAGIIAGNPAEYESLRKSLPRWILFFSIAGFDYFPQEKVAFQQQTVMKTAQKFSISPVETLSGIAAQSILTIFSQPSADPYWKIRQKGGCQDLFCLSTLDRIGQLIQAMQDQAEAAGYPTSNMGVYIQPMVQGSSCHLEFNLFYNPRNKREAALVEELYIRAGEALMNAGGFFSRPYGALTDLIYRRNAENTALLRKIKNIFDPKNVMNTGKLCFQAK